jgi:hypothetical protein
MQDVVDGITKCFILLIVRHHQASCFDNSEITYFSASELLVQRKRHVVLTNIDRFPDVYNAYNKSYVWLKTFSSM